MVALLALLALCANMYVKIQLHLCITALPDSVFKLIRAVCRVSGKGVKPIACDIVVAGGSLASLASAITAANNTAAKVCFLEPTDWPGGQMTSSAVPAIDFGPLNHNTTYLSASFVDMIWSQYPEGDNPGNCWVSYKCFDPAHVLHNWIFPKLASYKNLHVFLNTVVVSSTKDARGRITNIQAVHRVPLIDPWVRTLSEQVSDWYDPADSPAFSKSFLSFVNFSVVIEATEFGDVLSTSGVAVAQGFETPTEMSTVYYSACGQGVTVPFFMEWATANVTDDVPPGSDCGMPFTIQGNPWTKVHKCVCVCVCVCVSMHIQVHIYIYIYVCVCVCVCVCGLVDKRVTPTPLQSCASSLSLSLSSLQAFKPSLTSRCGAIVVCMRCRVHRSSWPSRGTFPTRTGRAATILTTLTSSFPSQTAPPARRFLQTPGGAG
jgi:hypothetical protein